MGLHGSLVGLEPIYAPKVAENLTSRQCFNRRCGRDASAPPSDCFTGQPLCQHGAAECSADRLLACGKRLDREGYMPFTYCLEASYEQWQEGGQKAEVSVETSFHAYFWMNDMVFSCIFLQE